MLNAYILQTQQLLQNPAAPTALYSTADLTSYINRARLILAGDAECIRVYAVMNLIVGMQQYQFPDINTAAAPGVAGVFNIRTIWVRFGGGFWLHPRPFEWFSLYNLNQVEPPQAMPTVWSQYGQGETGTFFVDPIPDETYLLRLDTVCVPNALATDADPEAIPYPWTDCVPFFAAYYALLSAQAPARQADAERMMQRYEEFKQRARRMSTPSVLPMQNPQTPNPFWAAAASGGGGGAQ